MPDPATEATTAPAMLRRKIQRLRAAIYSQTDPTAYTGLRAELIRAQAVLRDVEKAPAAATDSPAPATSTSRLLGPETTGLKVEPTLNMNPVPTAIYPFLDPETDPLLTVAMTNVSLDAKAKRISVRAWIEGLSAETVRTVELKRGVKEPTVLRLLPLFFPERIRQRQPIHACISKRRNRKGIFENC